MFTISKQFYSNNNGDEKQVAMKYNNVDDELKLYENINGKEKTKIEKHFLKKQLFSKRLKGNSQSNTRKRKGRKKRRIRSKSKK